VHYRQSANALSRFGGTFDIERKRNLIADLDQQTAMPGFWEDNDRAQVVLKEKGVVERVVRDFDDIREQMEDVHALIEMAQEEQDAETATEAGLLLEALELLVHALETRRLLSQQHDAMDAIVEINPGAGGTDACDWAQMLVRMYTRWAETRGLSSELLDSSPAEEAGIRSATLSIRGEFAFGYLQSETGVHRLVRISPFDQASRRHTAFAAVSVYPDIDDTIEVDLNPADIKMDTMRASGAGGQHINTTDSAVRLTHEPTGIVVLCRAERSQHKNRDKALKTLRAKLYQLELDKRQEAQDEVNAQKKTIDFGSQIRSYVMQPYQQVKDLRTGETVGDVQRVLDGAVTPFMASWLAARAESDNETSLP
jgi:peptide chain release factor 2